MFPNKTVISATPSTTCQLSMTSAEKLCSTSDLLQAQPARFSTLGLNHGKHVLAPVCAGPVVDFAGVISSRCVPNASTTAKVNAHYVCCADPHWHQQFRVQRSRSASSRPKPAKQLQLSSQLTAHWMSKATRAAHLSMQSRYITTITPLSSGVVLLGVGVATASPLDFH